MDAIPVVAIAVLQRLGLLDATVPEGLLPYARLTLRNWAGTEVGEIRAESDALASTAPTAEWAAFDAGSSQVYPSDGNS